MARRKKKSDWRTPIVDVLGVDDWWFEGTVIEALDGDTIKVQVEMAPEEIFKVVKFRMNGINAPEKNTTAGKASKQTLESILPAGHNVIVVLERGYETEKFGRWIGRVACEAVSDVATEMVRLGAAKEWDGKGVRPV